MVVGGQRVAPLDVGELGGELTTLKAELLLTLTALGKLARERSHLLAVSRSRARQLGLLSHEVLLQRANESLH